MRSIVVQADGKILASGSFNGAVSIGGETRNRIARLDPVTGLADSFDPNADAEVYSLALQVGGRILAGGNFLNVGGQARSHFARLTNDTTGLAILAATQSEITWTRHGATPLLARTTFEFSPDGQMYVPLANATSSGSDWALAGQSFPTGQNFFIRARGFYGGAYENGSISITESIRNAFVPGTSPRPTPTPIPTPTPTPTPGSTPTPGPSPTTTPTPTPTATPIPTPSGSPSPTPTPSPTTDFLGRLSTRAHVGTGANVLVSGFIITGNAPKVSLDRAGELESQMGETARSRLPIARLEITPRASAAESITRGAVSSGSETPSSRSIRARAVRPI